MKRTVLKKKSQKVWQKEISRRKFLEGNSKKRTQRRELKEENSKKKTQRKEFQERNSKKGTPNRKLIFTDVRTCRKQKD
ncbi:hypothetical protein A9239_10755 [Methanosarcina sp. A14]|uniref:Uncharacterized protein n=1 Tax=Methanosarcina barkeri MS TaxID=1434108 RepID=A0A0E3QVJ7_METBA|nr:hypothetical protein MSBRM_2511 [Methanosarcina barkeri MS]OED06930.1 hypothetical protein A9239_10755 [Methanosarcina sp. A14]